MGIRNIIKVQPVGIAFVLVLAGVLAGSASTISWSGGADGKTWGLAGNWVGGVVPGAGNDVSITSGSGTAVTVATGSVSVRSLQCTKGFSLSGGSLTLTGGGSQVSGAFSISGGADFIVTGAGASFTASGPTTAVDADIQARAGAVIHLPNLVVGTNNAYATTWRADGPGSVLDLASVTSLGLSFYERLYLQAYDGGKIDLHQVTSANCAVQVDVQDPGSIVDLSGIAGRWSSRSSSPLGLHAQSGASILIPKVTQLENASVRIDDTGVIPTAQLNLLTNVDLTADGASPNLAGITNIDESSLYALNGAEIRLPGVNTVAVNTQDLTWRTDGANSLVDLSQLKGLNVGYYHRIYLQAYSGGTVDVSRLNGITCALQADAQDAGSVINLTGLTGRWKSYASGPFTARAQSDATILIPNVTQLEYGTLRIDNTGVIPTAQLNLLTNLDLTVSEAAPDFSAVTNLDDTSVYALNGGVLRLTNVTSVTVGAQDVTWRADGGNSLVDLSALKTLNVGYYHRAYVQAYNGGTVDVHRLTHPTSSIHVEAEDADSVVNLSGLSGRWSSYASGPFSLRAQSGASILIPNVTQLEYGELRLDNTGSISVDQLNLLTNVDLTVDNATPNFAGLTNIDDSSIYALNGGVVRLPNLTTVTVGVLDTTWRADGAGSLVDLSKIKTLNVGYYHRAYLQAYDGGLVDLRGLKNTTSAIQVDAQDSGSVINLSGLIGRWSSYASSSLALRSQLGASILIPNVTELEYCSLRIDNTGNVTTAQLRIMTNVDLTVYGSVPNFSSLTNMDNTSVTAQNGGKAFLTNVPSTVVAQQDVTWKAEDNGSLIDLSGLSRVAVGYYHRLYIQAYDGGNIDLSQLQSLSTGAVDILADGSGSVVDLTGLSSFISVGSGSSKLTARNNGQVVLGSQAFLLANVGISIPAGNPVLPPTLTPSSSLSLYGTPWHAYWIDKRDTSKPDSPWVFMSRVPMVTALLALAPKVADHTEYRVFDFVADPPALDLYPAAGRQAQLVVYGVPGNTYQINSSPTIDPGANWQPGNVVAMTNAFRVLPPFSPNQPRMFYRPKKL